ncbi:MAG TPA: hypothetical protein QGH10_23955 [Armatimonadota bacterium]|nr:hypothetical protein [Armatimonadota bacterium]
MTRQRMALAGVAVFAVLAGAVGPAFAGDFYDIILANKLVLRLRDPGPSGSLTSRASKTEQHIVEALSVENVRTPNMWIEMEDDVPGIYIGETFLVEVLKGDLAGKDITAKTLAKQWMASFKQQFPRAEPVTGGGRAGRGGAGGRGSSGPVEVVIPEEDKEIVRAVLEILTTSRALEDDEFAAGLDGLAAGTATLVWRSAGEVHCDSVTEVEGSETAIRSALNGLRFAHDAEAADFTNKKIVVSYTIVKRVRKALTPTG